MVKKKLVKKLVEKLFLILAISSFVNASALAEDELLSRQRVILMKEISS